MNQVAPAECYATFDNQRLAIGNRLIERTWMVREGRLLAERFEHKPTGRQWIVTPAGQASLTIGATAGDGPLIFTAETDASSPVSAPSLRVILRGQALAYHLRLYPGAAGVEMQLVTTATALADASPAAAHARPTGVEEDQPTSAAAAAPPQATDVIDHFAIDPLHLRLAEVTLADQTDGHDNLVFERTWLLGNGEGEIRCRGNLFWLEDTIDGEGLILLKLAPLPHARPAPCEVDLAVNAGGEISLRGHGITGAGEGYPAVVLSYSGGRVGRIRALHDFQRQVRPYVAGRDGLLLSNTWGDRSRDGRINQAFIAAEIDAGGQLGVDVVQIDDGWERGTSANSVNRDQGGVWNGFWAADEHFWDPHPQRFPSGIRSASDRARAGGMKLGLWFAPDSSNDFSNWQRDVDAVLRMHREWGVDHVKIDGVKAHTRAGEANLRRFFDAVLDASHGRVVFDLDVTAEIRPGYFGLMHVGPIFVENRYTDWRRYWPHRTLRNLWMLSHYIDPLRLRMEFLNNQRNAERYADDPLAPAAYAADYLFATVMFSSPLGWFETSNLPAAYRERVAPLVATWKTHRDAIFAGTIIPIGDEPDGTRWTGFASIARDSASAYALVFREFNAQPEWRLACGRLGMSPRTSAVLAGDGEATVDGDDVRVKIPEARRFVLLRLSGA